MTLDLGNMHFILLSLFLLFIFGDALGPPPGIASRIDLSQALDVQEIVDELVRRVFLAGVVFDRIVVELENGILVLSGVIAFDRTTWKGYYDAFPNSLIKIMNCGLLLLVQRDLQSNGQFAINTRFFNLQNVYDSAHGILSQSIEVHAGVLLNIIAIEQDLEDLRALFFVIIVAKKLLFLLI